MQIPAVTPRITSTWGVLLGSLLTRLALDPGGASHIPAGRASTNTNTAQVSPSPSEKMLVVAAF